MNAIDKLTAALWNQPQRYARNRNFELHQKEAARKARAQVRLLRSLRRDLLAAGLGRAQREGDRYCLTIELDSIGLQRRVYLSPFLLALLLADPELGPRVAGDHKF